MVLAITAKRLFALLALDGVLQNVIADSTDEFLEEGLDLNSIRNLFLFVNVLLVLLSLVNYTFHL